MRFASKSYYEILDLDPAAPADEVRRAYTMVKATWDPGALATYSLYTPAESALICRKIDEAFQILIDPERRSRYDRYIKFLGSEHSEIHEPAAMWERVRDEDAPDDGIRQLTELLTADDLDDLDEELEERPAEAPLPLPQREAVEREWSAEVRRLGPTAGPATPTRPTPAAPPSAAEKAPSTPSGRAAPPPARRTWVSPTVGAEGGLPGTQWKRPENQRLRPSAAPIEERAVSAEELQALEARLGPSGAFLAAVREAKGISVEVVSKHTKIGTMYLRDIEAESWDGLPPAVYLRGFVLQYARLLKLDAERVADAFMARRAQNSKARDEGPGST